MGSSDKAAMHRRRHAASAVSHGFVAVDAYQEVEVGMGAGLFKCGDAPSVDGLEYHIQINTSSHHFYQLSDQQTLPTPYTITKLTNRNIYHKINQPTTTTTTTPAMSSQTVLKRNNSSSSAQSEGSTIPRTRNSNDSTTKRRSSDNKGQTSFMQYGRHSNQWIFEPLKETAKSFFGRKDSS